MLGTSRLSVTDCDLTVPTLQQMKTRGKCDGYEVVGLAILISDITREMWQLFCFF